MLVISFNKSTLGDLDRENENSSVMILVTMDLGKRGRKVLGSVVSQEGFEAV